jgi:hypothetical protein
MFDPVKAQKKARKECSIVYQNGFEHGKAAFGAGYRSLSEDQYGMMEWIKLGCSSDQGFAYAYGWNDGFHAANLALPV